VSNSFGHPYAGFWRRLAAYLIDGVLMGVVQIMLGIIVRVVAPNQASGAFTTTLPEHSS
jgi:RDD family